MKKITVGLMVAVSLFFVSHCFAEGLVVVIGGGDTIWARTCQTCAWTQVPGNLKTANVVWDAGLEKFVLFGTNAGGQIWSCTFDRGGNFQNDWVAVSGYAQWTTGASTNDKNGNAIRGEYALTGESTCLTAPYGFTASLIPVNGLGVIQTSSREGVFTFKHNGTGSATVLARIVTLPYQGQSGPVPPSAGTQELSFNFTYTVAHDGTMKVVPGTLTSTWKTGPMQGQTFYIDGVSFDGAITPDGKSITLNSGAPEKWTLTPSLISGVVTEMLCHNSSVLIWQH